MAPTESRSATVASAAASSSTVVNSNAPGCCWSSISVICETASSGPEMLRGRFSAPELYCGVRKAKSIRVTAAVRPRTMAVSLPPIDGEALSDALSDALPAAASSVATAAASSGVPDALSAAGSGAV